LRHRVRRLAAVVLRDDLELLAVDAARRVDLVERELPALAIGLGEGRQPRIGIDLADLDRIVGPRRNAREGRGEETSGKHGVNHLHVGSPRGCDLGVAGAILPHPRRRRKGVLIPRLKIGQKPRP